MSSYFTWDPARLSLQIPEMDDEHKVLIGLMNDLHELHEKSSPAAEQIQALEKLARYTTKHFADEEAYMERVGYPGLRVHKGVHKQLLDKVGEFLVAARSNRKLPEDLFVFLKMWLSAHICGIDMKYAQHARTAKSA